MDRIYYSRRVASRDLDKLIEQLRQRDPDLVLAADEVDADLLDWFETLSPAERLRRATQMAQTLQLLADARRPV